MATSRLSPLLLRTLRSSIPQATRLQRPLLSLSRPLALGAAHSALPRFYSIQNPAPSKPSKIYTFEEISSHLKHPSPERILIDTREPHELQNTGTIPGSLNIPITSSPDAFFLSDQEFEDKFRFERPGTDKEVVFYCKAGVRSRAAAELAKGAGWTKVGEYPGSWMDWEKRGGEREGGKK